MSIYDYIGYYNQARSVYSTIKPYYTKYKMLRGTRAKQSASAAWGRRQTLQNQITALKAQVSSNKPETQYYFNDGIVTTADGNDLKQQLSITSALKDDPLFRNLVTGEKWSNTALCLRAYLTSDNIQCRILVYVPKIPGDRFNPTGDTIFTTFPDPNQYWVVKDITVDRSDRTNSSGNNVVNIYAPLRGLITEYSSSADDIKKGEVVVAFFVNGSATTGNIQLKHSEKLIFHNK